MSTPKERNVCFPALIPRFLMATGNLVLMVLSLPLCVSAADPVVSNVQAAQRPGTKLMDITYDLADSDSSVLTVTVAVSDTGGATYAVQASSFSGDVGVNTAPGNNKRIVWNAGQDWNGHFSTNTRFKVTAKDSALVPVGMVLVPAGSFQMGDTFNEGWIDERPLRTVYVSGFYIDKYKVTKALWNEDYQWARAHGYSFDYYGAEGKTASHPATYITWYDAVKWCNARSEKEGRVPAYYDSAAQTTVYRSGQEKVQNDWVKWNAGYRLPTEAEWEKAARGELSGKRFPWGDTITHSQANYKSDSSYSYDISSTRGYHPTFATGSYPWSNPVGSFGANAYGLYDMAGNVLEWCWDWKDAYPNGGVSDPKGPSTRTGRVLRGGCWSMSAWYVRVACRSSDWAIMGDRDYGFRSVLPPGQPVGGASSSADSNVTTVDTRVIPVFVVPLDGIGSMAISTPPTLVPPNLPLYEQGKDSLVFITHGLTSKLGDKHDWVDTMAENIKSAGVGPNWQIIAFHWPVQSHDTFKVLSHARKVGESVGAQIVQYGRLTGSSGWKHVHLIGHSAGANLIDIAARIIKEGSVDTVVHTTFLDAFEGFLGFDGFLGLGVMGVPYGSAADWVDSYFSVDWETWGPIGGRTQGPLPYAYNVNVTQLDPNYGVFPCSASTTAGTTAPCSGVCSSTHSWPHEFYLKTITDSAWALTMAKSTGFLLSKESGRWGARDVQAIQHDFPPNASPVVLPEGVQACTPDLASSQPAFNSEIDFTLQPTANSERGIANFSPHGISLQTLPIPMKSPAFSVQKALVPTTTIPQSLFGSAAWFSVGVAVTNPINRVRFKGQFAGATNAQGLLTVYWNNQEVGSIDERYTEGGFQGYAFSLGPVVVDKLNVLGFRLDPFSEIPSAINLTNVSLGLQGPARPVRFRSADFNEQGGFTITLEAESGYTYLLQGSTNLMAWESVMLVTVTNSPPAGVITVPVVDAGGATFSRRFYRVKLQGP